MAPVTVVLVSHDGARWLPEVLAALAAQTVKPVHAVGVDTGSTDTCATLLTQALGAVIALPADTTYAAAVAAGLAAAPAVEWVWLLHDDSAPAPDALERLLAADPGTVLRGPKVVDWDDPRILLEVGLTTDPSGRRLTDVEPGEQDQGQHDGARDVLAVGTAGALVRRDVWDLVGGLDPAIAMFAGDLDLGRSVVAGGHRVAVVPTAVLRHARAATTGRRATGTRAVAADRRARAYVRLAHARSLLLPVTVGRLLLGALMAAAWLLLGRRPRLALDELAALTPLARPDRLLRARRRRRPVTDPDPTLLARRGARLPKRDLPLPSWGQERRRRALPGLLLVAAVGAVALVAERALLGGGVLAGGRLLPVPEGAVSLLRAYADGAPAATGVLGVLGGVLLGQADTAVTLFVLAAVPVSAGTAWWAAGRLVRRPVLRLWAGATWALLPVATGAVAAGRLDALAVQVALPVLLVAGYDVATCDPRGRWQRAWALGLALAAVVALAPVLWLVAAALLVVLAGRGVLTAGPGGRAPATRTGLAVLIALGVAAAVVPRDLADLLQGPGRLAPDLAPTGLASWRLPLLWPGGPGLPPVGLSLGLLAAAIAAALRRERSGPVSAGWVLALAGLAAAVLLARIEVAGLPVWPGVPLQLAAAGLLVAALSGADALPEQLQRNAFGRRQLLAVVVVATAVAVPVLGAASWVVRGADGPLRRGPVTALPAYARVELAAADLRALVLAPQPDGSVAYDVTGADGPRLTDPPPLVLDDVVADLLSPRGSDAAAALSTRAVRYVALTGGYGPDAAALDSQPGLLRQAGSAPLLWRVVAPAARLVLLSPAAATTAATSRAPTVAGNLVTDRVPPGPAGRLLVLAEPVHSGWQAELGTERLEDRTAWGWAQAWSVPAAGGALQVQQEGRSLPLTAVALGLLLVLAGPGGSRRRGLERR